MQVPFDLSITINPPSAHVSPLGLDAPYAADVTFGRNGQARTIRMFLKDGRKSAKVDAFAALVANAAIGSQAHRNICADLGINPHEVVYG